MRSWKGSPNELDILLILEVGSGQKKIGRQEGESGRASSWAGKVQQYSGHITMGYLELVIHLVLKLTGHMTISSHHTY
jgi:hypothetical protein